MSRAVSAAAPLAVVAGAGETIAGDVAIRALPRLAELVRDKAAGKLMVELSSEPWLAPGGQSAPRLRGMVRVTWPAVCQRCLEPLDLAIAAPVDVVITSQDIDDTGAAFDVWPADAATTLGDVIEEYVLLALPVAPAHEPACPEAKQQDNEPVASAGDTRRPFAGLKDLLDAGSD